MRRRGRGGIGRRVDWVLVLVGASACNTRFIYEGKG